MKKWYSSISIKMQVRVFDNNGHGKWVTDYVENGQTVKVFTSTSQIKKALDQMIESKKDTEWDVPRANNNRTDYQTSY